MESKKMSNLLENSTIALLPFARKTLVGRWSVNKEAIWNLLNSRGNPSTTTILSSVSSLSTSITVKGTAKIVKMTVFYTEEPEWRIASTDEPISTFAANVLTLLTSLPCTNKWKFVSLKDRSIIRIFCVPIYLCLEVSCDKRPKWKICYYIEETSDEYYYVRSIGSCYPSLLPWSHYHGAISAPIREEQLKIRSETNEKKTMFLLVKAHIFGSCTIFCLWSYDQQIFHMWWIGNQHIW